VKDVGVMKDEELQFEIEVSHTLGPVVIYRFIINR
jgi:hypothetical protein